MVSQFEAELDSEFEASQSYKPNKANWLEGKWEGLTVASGEARRGDSAVDMDVLRERLDILNTMEPYIGDWFSKEYVQKHVFRMTQEEINVIRIMVVKMLEELGK